MPVKFSDHIIAAGVHADRPVAADTPVAALYACTTHDIIYRNNGATWDDWIAAGGGGGGAGLEMAVGVEFADLGDTGNAYAGIADEARAFIIRLSAPMYIRALFVRVNVAGSGTHEWGLFDMSADATSGTKVAGGSGALNSTGWLSIAATGAPDLVPAGTYVLIFKWPNANRATLYYMAGPGTGAPIARIYGAPSAYTWTDTPDLTTTWTLVYTPFILVLTGDIDASGNQW